MKFDLVLLFSIIISYIHGHDFTICPNVDDKLHVKSILLNPDPPKAGGELEATVIFSPSTQLVGGKAIFSAKVLGLKVFAGELNVCDYTSCPIQSGKDVKLNFKYPLPKEIPHNVEILVTVSIESLQNVVLTCVQTKVDIAPPTEEDLEEKQKKYLSSYNNGIVNEKSIRYLFNLWLVEFGLIADLDFYPIKNTDSEDVKNVKIGKFEHRLFVFGENVVKIILHNRKFRDGLVTYTMSLNQFGHLNEKEFSLQYLNGYKEELRNEENGLLDKFSNFLVRIIPDAIYKANMGSTITHDKSFREKYETEIDWVSKGAVTPVKNQGSCGSCWAFSAISSLESAYFLKYGVLKSFSEQQLVSCENDCYGCGGGLMDLAFDWIKTNGGVCTEQDYPYVSGGSGGNGFCRPGKCQIDPQSRVVNFVDVDHTEEALMEAVSKQPVSIAIEADQYAFQFYSGGVLTAECGDKLDHGVVAVGYGIYEGNVPYWKVRNSWGANWGMQGYILLERGKVVPNGDEECGILANPSYPVL